jgi:hypothetical protein
MFNVKNNDSVAHIYYQATSPTVTGMSGVLALDPGQTGNSLVQWPCAQASSVNLYQSQGRTMVMGAPDGTGQGTTQGGTDTGATASGSPANGVPTPLPAVPVSSPPLNQYNPTNASQTGTNSPILWTPASGTNAALAAQQGFGALYDSGVKLGDQAHLDAQAIEAGVDGIYTNAAAVGLADAQFMSNAFARGITVTNIGIGGTNIISLGTNLATETTLTGISNLLSRTRTNNAEDTLSNLLGGLSGETNGAHILADTMSGLGGAVPNVSASDEDAGGGELLNVTLGGAGVGIVPLVMSTSALDTVMPAATAARIAFKWCILIILAICNYKVLVVEVRTTLMIPQARTAGTSLLGTNINSASAIVCAAIIVALAATLPTVFASGIVETFASISLSSPASVFAAASSVAYSFVSHYFPLAMLATAVVNHIAFRIASNIMELGAAAIVKFLVGI